MSAPSEDELVDAIASATRAAVTELFNNHPNVALIERGLAEMLAAEKFSGVEFHEIAGFNFLLA